MIIEITKQIKLVRTAAEVIYPYSNSIFIDDEVKTIIDAGAGGRAYAEIPCLEIQQLLLTHHHFDHINGIRFFPNARIWAGQEETWIYRDEDKFNEAQGYKCWSQLMGDISPYNKKPQVLPDDVPSRPGFQYIEIANTLKDGDVFNTGKTNFRAIHTPGHSPGHYAFYFPNEQILFSGDLDGTRRGPWYGFLYCDVGSIIESVNKLIDLQPRLLVSSHKRKACSGVEKIENILRRYLNILLVREENIHNYLTEPRSLDEIIDQRFVDDPGPTPLSLFWNKIMLLKHLQHLEEGGLVTKIEKNQYVRL